MITVRLDFASCLGFIKPHGDVLCLAGGLSFASLRSREIRDEVRR